MKPFALDSDMLTMGGVFYPTGHVLAMFPAATDAYRAADKLQAAGLDGDALSFVPTETILSSITHTVGSADDPLPSVGTEATTVRQIAALAAQGHCALLVHAPDAADSDHAMQVLQGEPVAASWKYRQLVIEDLVPAPA